MHIFEYCETNDVMFCFKCNLILGWAGFMGYSWTRGLWSIASTQLSRHRRNSHVLLGRFTGLVGKYSRKMDTRSEYPASWMFTYQLSLEISKVPIMFTWTRFHRCVTIWASINSVSHLQLKFINFLISSLFCRLLSNCRSSTSVQMYQ